MSESSHEFKRPVVLIVLDGWGIAAPTRANAITESNTPCFDRYVASYPTAVLQASGEAAGLPWGEIGNSEVGHMSIGAGRIVLQDLSRINRAISDGSFFENSALLSAIEHVKKNNSALHIAGMTSTSGVHSHIEHLYALLELVSQHNLPNVYIHAFLDGRDTSYASGLGFMQALSDRIKESPVKLASISGRYYAMDRDNHWERTEKTYRAMAEGTAEHTAYLAIPAIEQSYANAVYDEEFIPTVLLDQDKPVAAVSDNDGLIFFNIRADRVRQIVQSFCQPEFNRFEREEKKNLSIVTMTQYEKSLPVAVAFPQQEVSHSLAEMISAAGMHQLHIAETEKYAHITYFLNVGREEPLLNEDRIMIPSPHVDSYNKKPEMGALEITDACLSALQKDIYGFIAVNFANADMVAHTGDMKATKKAVEVLDQCLKRIGDAVLAKNGVLLITADHGNAEGLMDLHTGLIDKEHSNNPVPCILVAHELEGRSLNSSDVASKDLNILEPHGMLSDVAPTILSFMGIAQPPEMTGKNLLSE